MQHPFLCLAIMAAVVGLPTAMPMAQPVAASPAVPSTDDMPLADYLALLARIAPAAHDGAQTYLQSFQQRCGRPLRAAELRRAMSDGDGDPVLMSMIRASQLRDTNGLAQLGQRVACDQRRVP